MSRLLGILAQNAFHFGPKHFPFWAKTHSVLGQNAFHNFRNLNKKNLSYYSKNFSLNSQDNSLNF